MVLPGGRGSASGAGAAQSALLEGASIHRVPLDQKLRALARVYEVAAAESGVDLPLCADCAAEVHKDLEAQLAEVQQVWGEGRAGRARAGPVVQPVVQHGKHGEAAGRTPAALHSPPPLTRRNQAQPSPPNQTQNHPQEVSAYEAALQQLQAEGLQPLGERQFQQQLAAAEGEAQRERCVAPRSLRCCPAASSLSLPVASAHTPALLCPPSLPPPSLPAHAATGWSALSATWRPRRLSLQRCRAAPRS